VPVSVQLLYETNSVDIITCMSHKALELIKESQTLTVK